MYRRLDHKGDGDFTGTRNVLTKTRRALGRMDCPRRQKCPIHGNVSGQFLTSLGADPKCMKLLQNCYARVVADFFHRQVPVLQALQVSCKTVS